MTDTPRKVVDCHAHIFPYLGGASGFTSPEEHLLYVQRAMHTHMAQPVRRKRDGAIVREPTLWDPRDDSLRGRREVGFRAAPNGRFEWRSGGEDYYIQFMPPNLQDMAAPEDFMLAQMDYAGIDVAVLQNDHIYGSLNDYFAQAISRHPDRFIGLAQVEESRAYEETEIERLRRAVREQGLKGLYYTVATFFVTGYEPYYTDPRFEPFWDEVRDLQLPVFWVFPTSSPIGDFETEMRHFRSWLERYPEVPSVLVHGLPDPLFTSDGGRLQLPGYVTDLFDHFTVYSEVLFPIRWGGKWDYPYPQSMALLQQYYDRFGADRLIWGSDMPNVERYCTYRQTLTYLTEYCSFIPRDELDRILSRNTLGLFRR